MVAANWLESARAPSALAKVRRDTASWAVLENGALGAAPVEAANYVATGGSIGL